MRHLLEEAFERTLQLNEWANKDGGFRLNSKSLGKRGSSGRIHHDEIGDDIGEFTHHSDGTLEGTLHGKKFKTTCSGRTQSDRIAAIRKHIYANPEMKEAHREAHNLAQTGSKNPKSDGRYNFTNITNSSNR